MSSKHETNLDDWLHWCFFPFPLPAGDLNQRASEKRPHGGEEVSPHPQTQQPDEEAEPECSSSKQGKYTLWS